MKNGVERRQRWKDRQAAASGLGQRPPSGGSIAGLARPFGKLNISEFRVGLCIIKKELCLCPSTLTLSVG